MKFKDVVISEASTEAKVAALALLLDKELIKLADTVLNVKKLQGPKGEQGIQGPKGEQGDRGFDGTNGKDGVDGKDGKDGEDGKQGVGVADAKIDFDGSLVITLTDGTEINAGDVVPLDTAEKIRVIGNGGGTSQSVLDAIDAINAVIATYGTMATQNANAVAITGGSIDGTSIGASSASTGKFTTLTATGQTEFQSTAISGTSQVFLRNTVQASGYMEFAVTDGTRYAELGLLKSGTNGYGNTNEAFLRASGSTAGLSISSASSNPIRFSVGSSGSSSEQFRVTNTASAVNYVQVTGAATGNDSTISAQGSDANTGLIFLSKGSTGLTFRTRGGGTARNAFVMVDNGASSVNYLASSSNVTGSAPILSAQGSDTNIDLALTPKGTGNVRFGTLTASADVPITGYITIKDSGGTVRKLAVIA